MPPTFILSTATDRFYLGSRQDLNLLCVRILRQFGEQLCAKISWSVASPVIPMVTKSCNYHLHSYHKWGLPYDASSCSTIQRPESQFNSGKNQSHQKCEQIGRFFALLSTIQSWGQQLFYPNLPHCYTIIVKVWKSFIFLLKSFLGDFYTLLAIFIWSHWSTTPQHYTIARASLPI